MAKLYIAEFANLGLSGNGDPQIAAMPPLAEQTVAIGSEADSAALSAQTNYIRVHADAICSILIGAGNPTATTSKMRLAADQTEYFGVTPGHVVSVISNT